jgi:hypothetical protein
MYQAGSRACTGSLLFKSAKPEKVLVVLDMKLRVELGMGSNIFTIESTELTQVSAINVLAHNFYPFSSKRGR